MYKKNKQIVSEEKTSILFWILTAFVVLFMFWAPFQKGLFNGNTFDFERPIYSSLVWGFIIMFLASLYLLFNWKLQDHRDWLSLFVWLLPFTYLLARIHEASRYYSTNMLYIQMLYSIFFILGLYLCRSSLGNRIITYCIMVSGYVVVWFGMINWLGYKSLSASLVQWFAIIQNNEYKDAVMMADNQLRLTSIFQYANSYAAYLIALLLAAAYLIVKTRKPASILIHAFMLVPMLVSLLLTLSRGGLVILPVVLLLVLPFMKITKQIFVFIHFGIAGLISMLILNKITLVGEQFYLHQDLSTASTGLWILLGSSVGCAVIIWLLQRFVYPILENYFEAKIKNRFANILLPAAALIVGCLGIFIVFGNTGALNLFPDYIKQRIENINFEQHSVLERGTFYKDSIKLLNDYPLTGAGGGAWAALYEKYQNNPYVSRQAHNFFIQYLVETGIIGILILLAFLIYIFYLYIHRQLKAPQSNENHHVFFIFTIALLVHSIIDFDLSFVFLGVLVFLCLGAMISHIDTSATAKFIKPNALPYINKGVPAVLLVLSIVMFFISTQNLNANSLFSSAVANASGNKPINEVFNTVDKALKIHPNQPDYSIYKINILMQGYQQTKDEQYYTLLMDQINQLKQTEPHNRYLIDQELQAYLLKDQLTQAHDLARSQISNFPWDITLYEKVISYDLGLSEQARAQHNEALMTQYWNDAFDIHNMVLAKMKDLESLPKAQVQGREFDVTKTMAFNLGQIEYIRGQYASATEYLKMYVNDQFNDEMEQDIARWYLASLQKQNKNDQALYDKLIAKHPDEKDEINKLANATFSVK
ncbi:O-antigen ligase family protein [Paenibacillus doosanensis]|uniref:O-Antigen ligase n=1 Tax=Paenibacillus konkukensis TaxID=2020716 RepID=A0ABY4RPS4_9BACL|nr:MULTISPECIES: O-antigen ligase family protein [Paenibacillus]MCS7464260.1 O-antigen ligase family protein [Paenibacillus doosanensis]UQZ83965.1 O-Antigen ligase [Paenibacillus konkukensis]